jgi:hypothetical protein
MSPGITEFYDFLFWRPGSTSIVCRPSGLSVDRFFTLDSYLLTSTVGLIRSYVFFKVIRFEIAMYSTLWLSIGSFSAWDDCEAIIWVKILSRETDS